MICGGVKSGSASSGVSLIAHMEASKSNMVVAMTRNLFRHEKFMKDSIIRDSYLYRSSLAFCLCRMCVEREENCRKSTQGSS